MALSTGQSDADASTMIVFALVIAVWFWVAAITLGGMSLICRGGHVDDVESNLGAAA